MPDYTPQNYCVTVSDAFRNHIMNLFTLSNTGVNEFPLVISRASAGADDTLQPWNSNRKGIWSKRHRTFVATR